MPVTSEQRGAQAIVQAFLDEWNLSELSGWAWGLIQQGATPDQIKLELRSQSAYRAIYGAVDDARRQQGLPALSPAQIRAETENYRRVAAKYGKDFGSSPNDYISLFLSDKDAQEFDQEMGYMDTARRVGPHLMDAFQRYTGMNLTDGDIYGLVRGGRPDLAQAYAQATGTDATVPTAPDASKGPAPSPTYPEGDERAAQRAALERQNAALEKQIQDWGAGKSTKSAASIEILIDRQTAIQRQITAMDQGPVKATPVAVDQQATTTPMAPATPINHDILASHLSGITGQAISSADIRAAFERAAKEEMALYAEGGEAAKTTYTLKQTAF